MDIEKAKAWCKETERLLKLAEAEEDKLLQTIESIKTILGDTCPEWADEAAWEDICEELSELEKLPKGIVKNKKSKPTIKLNNKKDWTEFISKVDNLFDLQDEQVKDILSEVEDIIDNSVKPDAEEWETFRDENDVLNGDWDREFTAEEKIAAVGLKAKANEVAEELKDEQEITHQLTNLVYGQPLSTIGATAAGGGTLQYAVNRQKLDASAILDAGDKHVVEIVAGSTDKLKSAQKTITIKVAKDTPKVMWPTPLPVLIDKLLTAFTLSGATTQTSSGNPIVLTPPLTYAPALNTKVTADRTLTATFAGNTNFNSVSKSVTLKVVANLTELGKEAMKSGRSMKESTILSAHKDLLDEWNTDDDPKGLKKQSKKVMSDIKNMTADELIDYMNKFVSTTGEGAGGGYVAQGSGNNLNMIWYLPNGLQVRYKPFGKLKPPLTGTAPMFSIEGKTCNDPNVPSTKGVDADVAFKVTEDGEPGPYGPKQTALPEGIPNDKNDSDNAEYMNSACDTTHLKCKPKVAQEIKWTNPPDITVGDPLGEASLQPIAQDPTTVFEFSLDSGNSITKNTVLSAKKKQKLRVKGKETLRYLASTEFVEVEINVNKKVQTVEWKPLKTELEVGMELGDQVLNATASSGATPVYYKGDEVVTKTTKLPPSKDKYKLKAVANETDTYNASNPVEVEIIVNKKAQTVEWKPLKTELEVGMELGGQVLNAITTSGLKPVYYLGDEVVTETTKLPASETEYELKAVAKETDEYDESKPETVTITVNPQKEMK